MYEYALPTKVETFEITEGDRLLREQRFTDKFER